MKKEKEYTESALIKLILQGDLDLFSVLIRKNNPFLYKTGRSYGYNHEDTQDLMQETFISAYTNLKKFEGRSAFTTWIVRIMLNKCFHASQKHSYKNEKADSAMINEKSNPMYSANSHTDPSRTMLNRELSHVIENSMYQIPLDYRMVFALREVSGLSQMETAEALQISESNVKVRLHRAKALLRGQIEKVYSAGEIYEFNLVFCDAMVKRVMDGIAALDNDAKP